MATEDSLLQSLKHERTRTGTAMAETARLRAERDAYAFEALAALAGAGVATPATGYVKDGGPGLLASDIKRLAKERDAFREAMQDMAARWHKAQEEVERLNRVLLDELQAGFAAGKQVPMETVQRWLGMPGNVSTTPACFLSATDLCCEITRRARERNQSAPGDSIASALGYLLGGLFPEGRPEGW